MANKKTAAAGRNTKHPGTGRTCGECIRGEYSKKHINRNVNGEPFLIECPFSTWARNAEGASVCLVSTAACSNFQEGQR